MNLKNVLKKDKKSAVKAEEITETPKIEPVAKAEWKKKKESTLKAKPGTKWYPKPAGKGAKRTKRF